MMNFIIKPGSGFYKRKYFFILIFVFILIFFQTIFPYSLIAQQKNDFKRDQYRAINWTTDDGLGIGIHYVIKDSKGFTWVWCSVWLASPFRWQSFRQI